MPTTSQVIDESSAPDAAARPAVMALAARPGLLLPLLLIALALAVTVFASVQLVRLEMRLSEDPAADRARLFAQAATEALRLHDVVEHKGPDPAARQELVRRHNLLLLRLDQLQPGAADPRTARGDEGVALAIRRLRDRDPAALAQDGRERADLAAWLTNLERDLSRAGVRAHEAWQRIRAERAARLRGVLVLGATAVAGGLTGLVWLVTCLLVTLRRVEADRRLERDLRREREAAAYLRNIGAVIAHQMRAPLAVIDSAAQRMLGRLGPDRRPEDGAALLRIRRQVRRMLHFMEQAMLAGELETGTPAHDPRPVRLQDLLTMVTADEGLGDRRRLVLPEGGAEGTAFCDPSLAFHALANLVENALKYSPPGSPVELRAAQEGGTAVLSVIDRGPGVPPHEQEAIFQRFRRGAGAAGRPGSGVGLWLARRLAEVQGGTVRLASDDRTGARFDLVLPAAPAVPAPAQARHGPA